MDQCELIGATPLNVRMIERKDTETSLCSRYDRTAAMLRYFFADTARGRCAGDTFTTNAAEAAKSLSEDELNAVWAQLQIYGQRLREKKEWLELFPSVVAGPKQPGIVRKQGLDRRGSKR